MSLAGRMEAERAAAAEKAKASQRVCPTGKLLQRMQSVDRVATVAALADELISNTALSDALRDEGYPNDRGLLGKHRRGDCRCGTE